MASGENYLPRGQRRNIRPYSTGPWNRNAQMQPGKRHLALCSRETEDRHPGHHSL